VLIFPAIDLLDGKCVRLKQGVEKTAKVYHPFPAEMAKQWQEMGARYLHVVNLDGAFGRAQKNIEAIQDILHAVSIPVQLGGGIRNLQDIQQWLSLGISRVILGTIAVTEPEIVQQAVDEFGPDSIVVGVDAREDKVAIHGWETQTQMTIPDLVRKIKSYGVRRIVYTDIQRDGKLVGPNITRTVQIANEMEINVIASGGFSDLEHLRTLQEAKSPYIEGAIIGTALYERQLDLVQLSELFQ